ncbi:MAG: PfkB family carbohydrate kinase, partial [Saprospiraceae bacterium]|nr:PfkB family carbohydrate kinase [Saprospiraceae bacterium]
MGWQSEYFERLPQMHIAVIGDVMLDRYMWGNVDRISPEAPVPILHLRQSEARLGGAANVALNLSGLEVRTSLLGYIGKDERGEQLLALAAEAGIDVAGIVAIDGWPTTTKTRVISGHQHLLRVDEEERCMPSQAETARLLEQLNQRLADARPDAVILQDYNKGVLAATTIDSILRRCHALQIPVMVDPKDDNFLAYRGATIFKPNLRELQAR